ncbi:hypothetical protein ACHQM5_015212 [Ranunculus cassubicifolius]
MALKCFLFVSLLLVIGSTAPLSAEAQIIGNLLGLLRIQGLVPCTNATTNATVAVNGTAIPPFPNAVVQLQCGSSVIASATTILTGRFSIVLNDRLDPQIMASIIPNCSLVVKTPLSNCNATLPATGTLTSRLQVVTNTTTEVTIIPLVFLFTLA